MCCSHMARSSRLTATRQQGRVGGRRPRRKTEERRAAWCLLLMNVASCQSWKETPPPIGCLGMAGQQVGSCDNGELMPRASQFKEISAGLGLFPPVFCNVTLMRPSTTEPKASTTGRERERGISCSATRDDGGPRAPGLRTNSPMREYDGYGGTEENGGAKTNNSRHRKINRKIS